MCVCVCVCVCVCPRLHQAARKECTQRQAARYQRQVSVTQFMGICVAWGFTGIFVCFLVVFTAWLLLGGEGVLGGGGVGRCEAAASVNSVCVRMTFGGGGGGGAGIAQWLERRTRD